MSGWAIAFILGIFFMLFLVVPPLVFAFFIIAFLLIFGHSPDVLAVYSACLVIWLAICIFGLWYGSRNEPFR